MYQSFLNALFYRVNFSFWSLTPFSLPARPVPALDDLLYIKLCSFLSPFWMGLTNPGWALRRLLLLSISRKPSTMSGTLPFSTNLFRLVSQHALFVGSNLSFLIGVVAWFFKITKVVPFESVEVFRKDPFLLLYFLLFSSVIFLLHCLFPSAAFIMLTIWPFFPHTPQLLMP